MPFTITDPQKKKLKAAGGKLEKIKARIKEIENIRQVTPVPTDLAKLTTQQTKKITDLEKTLKNLNTPAGRKKSTVEDFDAFINETEGLYKNLSNGALNPQIFSKEMKAFFAAHKIFLIHSFEDNALHITSNEAGLEKMFKTAFAQMEKTGWMGGGKILDELDTKIERALGLATQKAVRQRIMDLRSTDKWSRIERPVLDRIIKGALSRNPTTLEEIDATRVKLEEALDAQMSPDLDRWKSAILSGWAIPGNKYDFKPYGKKYEGIPIHVTVSGNSLVAGVTLHDSVQKIYQALFNVKKDEQVHATLELFKPQKPSLTPKVSLLTTTPNKMENLADWMKPRRLPGHQEKKLTENGATAAMVAALAIWKKEIINEITKFKNRDGRTK